MDFQKNIPLKALKNKAINWNQRNHPQPPAKGLSVENRTSNIAGLQSATGFSTTGFTQSLGGIQLMNNQDSSNQSF